MYMLKQSMLLSKPDYESEVIAYTDCFEQIYREYVVHVRRSMSYLLAGFVARRWHRAIFRKPPATTRGGSGRSQSLGIPTAGFPGAAAG